MLSLGLLVDAALSGALPPAASPDPSSAPIASPINGTGVNASGCSAPAPKPQPPTIAQALESGVLIVISTASQRMHVFKDGEPWMSSPISTGRPGHRTPVGVFSIIEKQRYHRSNIYSNAPMPFMQRLTMGGIAIHAGYVPGHPASHGCIRAPYAVARSLFGLTRTSDTAVVISNEAMPSDEQARSLALAVVQQPKMVQPAPAALACASPQLPNKAGPAPPPTALAIAQPRPDTRPDTRRDASQTIQLAAAASPQEAEARWSGLLSRHAELGSFTKTVVPVLVGSRRLFRLRASGPSAFTTCTQLKSAGLDCFRVL